MYIYSIYNTIIMYHYISRYSPIHPHLFRIYVHLSLDAPILSRRLRQLIDLHALAQPLDGGGIQVVGVRNQAVGQLDAGNGKWSHLKKDSERKNGGDLRSGYPLVN